MSKEKLLHKLKEWTLGLGPLESRKTVFERIRDIPYYLVPQVEDPYEWAGRILDSNKASCSPKHYLLGFLFIQLGIPVKYATYPFKWDKQPIKYPSELMDLAQGSPIGYHSACKAFIEDKWVLVDATWDKALKRAGFSVNEDWDGFSDTLNAVVPFNEIIHESLEERLVFVREKKSMFSEQEKSTYVQFIEKFNAWLENLRR
ncbi:MAG: hypothetical protein KJ880_02050 [Candidatus Omnitrophica bacterium]|nr:hypothetical protein [Candidatus Omnitrophota bacterium]MBU1870020.1 hypothetical protein [Candidatus Omnitrophota bacterium]